MMNVANYYNFFRELFENIWVIKMELKFLKIDKD